MSTDIFFYISFNIPPSFSPQPFTSRAIFFLRLPPLVYFIFHLHRLGRMTDRPLNVTTTGDMIVTQILGYTYEIRVQSDTEGALRPFSVFEKVCSHPLLYLHKRLNKQVQGG